MAKFKLTKKKNPMKKDEPGKWYAIPCTVNRLDTRSVCKTVTRNTTTAPTEAESTFNLVVEASPTKSSWATACSWAAWAGYASPSAAKGWRTLPNSTPPR